MPERYHLNVAGPFYVVDQCCLACGIPDAIAPALFGGSDGNHCYVKRQPETDDEMDAMVNVLVTQDVGCIRYAGSDRALLRRLAENGGSAQCDVAPPRDAIPLRRDHVVFSATEGPWTPQSILERLVLFAAQWRTTAISDQTSSATVSICSFGDDYHRIDVFAGRRDGEWVLRHQGSRLECDMVHAWLLHDSAFVDARWQTKAQWLANGASQPKPW